MLPTVTKGLSLLCPACSNELRPLSDCEETFNTAWIPCDWCPEVIRKTNGVWRMLSTQQRIDHAAFLRDYETIRRTEGRGSDRSDFYLALPFADVTGRFSEQWKIRARSYRFLEETLLPSLEQRHGSQMRVLDIGAGNGWLSYRLALRGYLPAAVDLCRNEWDGLEAAKHYTSAIPGLFPRIEAEMDNLPFANAQFDVAIFNASFHYSADYSKTLRETLRCLRSGGTILIVDSPTYRSAAGGEAMRRERQRSSEARFGVSGDAHATQDFLTPEIVESLSGLGIQWTRHLASYGLRWSMRPLIARLKRRREPSQFYLYEGRMLSA